MPRNSLQFCKLQDHITAAVFGCEPGYFDRFLKDQPLEIICALGGYVRILSADGEHWDLLETQVNVLPAQQEAV